MDLTQTQEDFVLWSKKVRMTDGERLIAHISFGRGTTSNDRLHEGEIRSEQSTDLGGVESTSGETLGESSETQTSERGAARVESVDGLRMRVRMARKCPNDPQIAPVRTKPRWCFLCSMSVKLMR